MGDQKPPTIFSEATCIRRDLCPVTKIRHQESNPIESHSIYFEVHGDGDALARGETHKLVFIMGLNSSSFAWKPQVEYFTSTPELRAKYTVLIFDNRGVGNSGYPMGPYTTSGMAADVVALLDYLDWKKERDLNIIGVSLGGMISLELATLIPERISSLLLTVTTPGNRHWWQNMAPWVGMKTLARLTFTTPEKRPPIAMDMLFPQAWLNERDPDDPKGRTNREVQIEDLLFRISNTRPQQLMGHISQMIAALSHYVDDSRLAAIGKNIGAKEKGWIGVVCGDEDHLVLKSNSLRIVAGLRSSGDNDIAEYEEWPVTAHGIHVQRRKRFCALIERGVAEGLARRG
ncbi:Alpha/Beta hydrolase protein [Schizophyllum amplum]|uniref:Alpha/Beta hydrolase protein n=1 Tax=Schizophyllum amplum TaxID=97359 RepID=A0A550C2M3_9AGAR|nr:Alpha/Beta hydrolase protein [Auriculariopsis ampla]